MLPTTLSLLGAVILILDEWHCRMAAKDLRRGPAAAKISLGANAWRIVPAEFYEKFRTPFASAD